MIKALKNQVRRIREKRKSWKLARYIKRYDHAPSNEDKLQWEDIHSIALLRWDNKLGDAIMCGAFLSAMRQHRPDIKITIITQTFCADWFKKIFPECDIILCGGRSVKNAESFAQYRGQFDALVDLGTYFSFKELAAIYHLGAPFNIGYDKEKHPIFTHNVPLEFIHFKQRYLQAAQLFISEILDNDIDLPVLNFAHVETFALSEHHNHVAINLFGASKYRQFNPPYSLNFLNAWLNEFPNDHLHLIPVPGKIEALESLILDLNNPRVSLASKVPSLELTLRLLSQVDLCFTTDTSVVHMASALNTPTLAVFGDNTQNIAEWCPIAKHSEIILNPKPNTEYHRVFVHEFDWNDFTTKRKSLIKS